MKKHLIALLLLLACAAFAQNEAPAENPQEVWVKGRRIPHGWRDGRITVNTHDLKPLLGMDSDLPWMDLLKALEEKGGYVWAVDKNGRFEAKRDRSKYAVADSTAARVQNSRAARRRRSDAAGDEGQELPGYLVYKVERFTADTGYVRAYITVKNEGKGQSEPSEAICQFQDGFGKTYAEHKVVVPALAPGQKYKLEAFSMTEVEDTSITPTADNVAVNFFGLTSGAGPNSISEARKDARARKRSRL